MFNQLCLDTAMDEELIGSELERSQGCFDLESLV